MDDKSYIKYDYMKPTTLKTHLFPRSTNGKKKQLIEMCLSEDLEEKRRTKCLRSKNRLFSDDIDRSHKGKRRGMTQNPQLERSSYFRSRLLDNSGVY